MPHDTLLDLKLGRRYAAVMLTGRLVDVYGGPAGLPDVTGFRHMGSGDYLCVLSLPDGFLGGVQVFAPGESDPVMTVGLSPGEEEAAADLLAAIPGAVAGITAGVQEQLTEFADELTERIVESVHNLDIEVVQSRTVFGPQPIRTAAMPKPTQGAKSVRPGVLHPAVVPMPRPLPDKPHNPLSAKRNA